jgi:hypothetical protein
MTNNAPALNVDTGHEYADSLCRLRRAMTASAAAIA